MEGKEFKGGNTLAILLLHVLRRARFAEGDAWHFLHSLTLRQRVVVKYQQENLENVAAA